MSAQNENFSGMEPHDIPASVEISVTRVFEKTPIKRDVNTEIAVFSAGER